MNVIITGFGGQGVVFASKLLSEYYFQRGQDVKTATIIGLGVKGGGIYCHVKSGSKVVSPLIPRNNADVIVGMEDLETLRWIDYLKPNGLIIMNKFRAQPTIVSTGIQPDFSGNVNEILAKKTDNIRVFNGYSPANSVGGSRTLNLYMVGVLCGIYKYDIDLWKKILQKLISKKILDRNLSSFLKGYNTGLEEIKRFREEESSG
jgi:indolepyruvate ferredoxin oxidoreductase beta subunit